MKKLFKIGLLAATVGAVYKVISAKKEEWSGLSEDEVRGKLNDKLASRTSSRRSVTRSSRRCGIRDDCAPSLRGN